MQKMKWLFAGTVLLALSLAAACGPSEPEHTRHTFGAWETIREASCTQEGEQKRSCTLCGEQEHKSIEKIPHAFGGRTFYEYDGDADPMITTHQRCRVCEEKGPSQPFSEACVVVRNREEAQLALDKAKSDDVIFFLDGEYGGLEIRQSKYTSTVEDGTSIADLKPTGHYSYSRRIENLRLLSAGGAVIDGKLYLRTGEVRDEYNYDAVRELQCSFDITYDSSIQIKNLSVEGLRFTGEESGIELTFYDDEASGIDGLRILNCAFDTGIVGIANGVNAVDLNADHENACKNVTVSDCVIENYSGGVRAENVQEELTIRDCRITGIESYAILLVNPGLFPHSGRVLIEGNTIRDVNGCAVQFGLGDRADIRILNNAFSQVTERENRLVKSDESFSGTVTFAGNTYAGAPLEDRTLDFTSAPGKVTVTYPSES